jgi:hypoxanthine phosphoribosyltransferase
MQKGYKCGMLSWDQAYMLAKKAARKIVNGRYEPDHIIGIARGGWVPSMMLSDLLGVKDLLSIRIEHWGTTGIKDNKAVLKYPLQADISGEKILLVDDLTDTGDSMLAAIEHLKTLKPGAIKTAVLIHKTQSKYKPDYYALEKDRWSWIILPWNLNEDLTSLVKKASFGKVDQSPGDLNKNIKKMFGIDIDQGTLADIIESNKNIPERKWQD